MNDNKEIAQRIIDKYVTILGILPVYLFSQQIPDLKLNKKAKVIGLKNDKVTLLKFINSVEPFTGRFIKDAVIKKFMESYNHSKDII